MTLAPRPLIGVTKPSHGDALSFLVVCLALWLAGARTVRLVRPPGAMNGALDGLLLGGGSDVYPASFHPPKAGYDYDLERQALELDWIARASESDLPVLGICRGAQLINVAAGGSLVLDLAATYNARRYPRHWLRQAYFRKRIQIARGSRLGEITGVSELWVNSVHRQAVGDLGAGLAVAATEDNGVIQAIEAPRCAFFIGVQFHPELLIYKGPVRRLFAAFVDAARAYRRAQAG